MDCGAVRVRSKERWNIVIILFREERGDCSAVRRRRRSAMLRCAVQCCAVQCSGVSPEVIVRRMENCDAAVRGGEGDGRRSLWTTTTTALPPARRNIVIIADCSAVRALSKERWDIVIIWIREALWGSAVRALSKERWNIVIILIREERGGIDIVGGGEGVEGGKRRRNPCHPRCVAAIVVGIGRERGIAVGSAAASGPVRRGAGHMQRRHPTLQRGDVCEEGVVGDRHSRRGPCHP